MKTTSEFERRVKIFNNVLIESIAASLAHRLERDQYAATGSGARVMQISERGAIRHLSKPDYLIVVRRRRARSQH